MSDPKVFKVLFLSNCNSANSIFAEFMMKKLSMGRFESESAGITPAAEIHPLTVKILDSFYGIPIAGVKPKSVDDLRGRSFDFVITVNDRPLENIPVFAGDPVRAQWGSPDPAAFQGGDEEKLKIFRQVAVEIHRRLELFTSLPLERFDHASLKKMIEVIGESRSR
ncbi:MAG: arsenate reductase ArsC [Verrucomicrobiae bacterium]|nr:arsenate reductase ArsC [Verrucomicrobiae bacterium]